MEVATITVDCCKQGLAKEGKIATLQMNSRQGLLHYRCAYCGFELQAWGNERGPNEANEDIATPGNEILG